MEKRFKRTVTLFGKSYAGTITEQEKAELSELLKDRFLNSVYEQLKSGAEIAPRLSEYASYRHQDAFREFERKVKKRGYARLYTVGVTVAASVVIAFSLIWILNAGGEEISRQQMTAANTTIAPGTKKAQIRMADGSVVNVTGDSMRIEGTDGTLIDYNKGEIRYKQEEEVNQLVYNELIVPLAGECYIVLDDGTRVWVNSDTKLKYPVKFIGNERKVFLEGEAYFEVTKDTKPFIVHTYLGDVNVLGTSFDVKAYKEDAHVATTLVTGKVRFRGKETVEISPGEQMVALASGKMEKKTVDIAEYIGWKEGLYVFRDKSLETIMTTLARWYDVNIFYQNSAVKSIQFTGNLKRYDNINTFMEVLARTGDVKYKINGNTITLFQ